MKPLSVFVPSLVSPAKLTRLNTVFADERSIRLWLKWDETADSEGLM
jgi:hypothetical protein